MRKYIVLGLLLLSFSSQVFSGVQTPIYDIQDSNNDIYKKYNIIQEQGDKANEDQDYTYAIQKYLEAEVIAKQHYWKSEVIKLKSKIAFAYLSLSNYGESLDYYIKTLKLLESTPENSHNFKAKILTNIGYIFTKKEDYNNALKYYNEAFTFLNDKNINAGIKTVGINIANIYNIIGEHKKAEKMLMEIYKVKEGDYVDYMWKITYAESLFFLGEKDQAYKIATELYKITQENNRSICNICVLNLLSKISEKEKNYEKAIDYSKRALFYNKDLLTEIEQYNRLALLYTLNEDYMMSSRYKDSIILATEKFNKEKSIQLYEINRAKLKLNEYQNEIKINETEYKNNLKILWICIICILLLTLLVYLWQTNRIAKQKQMRVVVEKQKMIAENQKAITVLELEKKKSESLLLIKEIESVKDKAKLKRENLKNKIALKNRELTTNALYHSSRIEILNEIVNSLEKIRNISKDVDLNSYINSLREYINTSETWKEFTNHFEQVNPGLLLKLQKTHPDLTKKDIRFLCYLYMNLSAKEISTIFNITPDAFRKRKQRISDKLNLPKEENLYNYMQNILND